MNSGCNILNIPDEILIEIILYLNARERVPLGDSCKRFNALVFEEKKLLRDLDFSKDGYLTSASDVYRYFVNENRSKHILKVNLLNYHRSGLEDILSNHIRKAINLTELNVHGLSFQSLGEMERLLCPFHHVKRLSFDWPLGGSLDDIIRCEELNKLLGRLTYWSVRGSDLTDFSYIYYTALYFCNELKELRIRLKSSKTPQTIPLTRLSRKLKNLEIVEYCGPCVRDVEAFCVALLQSPEEWSHFQLYDHLTCADGFHLERNVKVCRELVESKSVKSQLYNYPSFASILGGFVVSACILEDIMKIKGDYLQDKFCCFSSANDEDQGRLILPTVFHASQQWMLKLEEAKRLLEDPRYSISYLNIFHNIDRKCDAHIVTSAFSSITELVLSNLTKSKQRKDSASPDELDQLQDIDSSFSKLVKSTPHLRHLSIIADTRQLEDDETWDLASLHLISGWKNLTSLCLWFIPIMDGNFLTEIGRQCKHLETIELYNLGPSAHCNHMNGLLRMLIHCTNLRDFTLRHGTIDRVSDLLFLLANNPKLKRVYIKIEYNIQNFYDVRPAVEQLLHRCSELTRFMLVERRESTDENGEKARTEWRATLERLKKELNRPSLQFKMSLCEEIDEDESAVPRCLRFD